MALRTALLSVVLVSSLASAQMLNDQGPPLHRLVHKNTLALRINPLGLIYDGRFSYRLRLYESDSKALRDNFIGIGVAPMASPAFLRIGPYVEFNPLTILGFYGMIQFVQYFGSMNLLQGYPFAQSDFSDTAIKANGANRIVTNGYEVTLGANFQVKVAMVVVRAFPKLVYGKLRLNAGDTIYYDQTYDVGVPNDGWFFTSDFDLLFQGLENKLVAGARYTFTNPFYDARQLDPNSPAADNSMHRVGPFAAYTFKMEDGAKFNTPTVFLVAQWWVKHRFRTGQDTPTALPLIAVGFQMTGDFLTVK